MKSENRDIATGGRGGGAWGSCSPQVLPLKKKIIYICIYTPHSRISGCPYKIAKPPYQCPPADKNPSYATLYESRKYNPVLVTE